jgi:hypothetical protein
VAGLPGEAVRGIAQDPRQSPRLARRFGGNGREIHRNPLASSQRFEAAAPRLETHGLVGSDVALFPQHVGRRQRGVPAQGHLRDGREPPQRPGPVRQTADERGFGQVQLGGDRLHPTILPLLIQNEHAGRVAREGPLGERVHDEQRLHARDCTGRGHECSAETGTLVKTQARALRGIPFPHLDAL